MTIGKGLVVSEGQRGQVTVRCPLIAITPTAIVITRLVRVIHLLSQPGEWIARTGRVMTLVLRAPHF
ncbi:hypothetical protein WH87_15830 [Devosia epidermidihirudinis]|uniref:Uncharacterized protein n=1 Tax=Devosia epidermidihirudinis TaxID=1293439 RepID=A0A0F5Q3R8_9HYPH|nr:hypothetical protein WH87_15830 [Devosia epidermidihirudinis]